MNEKEDEGKKTTKLTVAYYVLSYTHIYIYIYTDEHTHTHKQARTHLQYISLLSLIQNKIL